MNKALIVALLIFAPVSPGIAASAAPSTPEVPSQQDQNKLVARRVFEEILNQGKFQVADEIYTRDFVNHGLHRNADLQEDQAAARWEKKTAPDLTMTVNFMVAEGDLVTVVWTARANTVTLWRLPAMRIKLEDKGITVWRIVDGKIRDEWTAFDLLRIVRQFVVGLKWLLLGLLCAVVILFWVVGRLIRKMWLTLFPQPAKATS
jgi:predicted SnoaL-like aldol condensation-catalyzing enzyme